MFSVLRLKCRRSGANALWLVQGVGVLSWLEGVERRLMGTPALAAASVGCAAAPDSTATCSDSILLPSTAVRLAVSMGWLEAGTSLVVPCLARRTPVVVVA